MTTCERATARTQARSTAWRCLGLRRGFLFSEDVAFPASVVASVGDGAVYLVLDRAEINRLPPAGR